MVGHRFLVPSIGVRILSPERCNQVLYECWRRATPKSAYNALELSYGSFGDCPGGGRGLANAVRPTETVASDLWPSDGDARHPRAGRSRCQSDGRRSGARGPAPYLEGAGAGAGM